MKIIEIWPMTDKGQIAWHFLIKIIEIWPMTDKGHFLYTSLSQSLRYDLWLIGAISFTIPYQNHWNSTCDCYGQFPSQFLIRINEIWPMTAEGNFLYKSLWKLLKHDLWLLGAISFTIPYDQHAKTIHIVNIQCITVSKYM